MTTGIKVTINIAKQTIPTTRFLFERELSSVLGWVNPFFLNNNKRRSPRKNQVRPGPIDDIISVTDFSDPKPVSDMEDQSRKSAPWIITPAPNRKISLWKILDTLSCMLPNRAYRTCGTGVCTGTNREWYDYIDGGFSLWRRRSSRSLILELWRCPRNKTTEGIFDHIDVLKHSLLYLFGCFVERKSLVVQRFCTVF